MKNPDEPLFERDDETPEPEPGPVQEHIRELVEGQPYAVLCVQGDGQPYGALVAFAFSPDLRHACFATPMATRKFRLLSECDHVALVVDSRSSASGGLMGIEAFTATGRAVRMERGPDFDRWAELLVSRHSYLQTFVKAATCALFRIDVVRFIHVSRFQEVRQWIPPAS